MLQEIKKKEEGHIKHPIINKIQQEVFQSQQNTSFYQIQKITKLGKFQQTRTTLKINGDNFVHDVEFNYKGNPIDPQCSFYSMGIKQEIELKLQDYQYFCQEEQQGQYFNSQRVPMIKLKLCDFELIQGKPSFLIAELSKGVFVFASLMIQSTVFGKINFDLKSLYNINNSILQLRGGPKVTEVQKFHSLIIKIRLISFQKIQQIDSMTFREGQFQLDSEGALMLDRQIQCYLQIQNFNQNSIITSSKNSILLQIYGIESDSDLLLIGSKTFSIQNLIRTSNDLRYQEQGSKYGLTQVSQSTKTVIHKVRTNFEQKKGQSSQVNDKEKLFKVNQVHFLISNNSIRNYKILVQNSSLFNQSNQINQILCQMQAKLQWNFGISNDRDKSQQQLLQNSISSPLPMQGKKQIDKDSELDNILKGVNNLRHKRLNLIQTRSLQTKLKLLNQFCMREKSISSKTWTTILQVYIDLHSQFNSNNIVAQQIYQNLKSLYNFKSQNLQKAIIKSRIIEQLIIMELKSNSQRLKDTKLCSLECNELSLAFSQFLYVYSNLFSPQVRDHTLIIQEVLIPMMLHLTRNKINAYQKVVMNMATIFQAVLERDIQILNDEYKLLHSFLVSLEDAKKFMIEWEEEQDEFNPIVKIDYKKEAAVMSILRCRSFAMRNRLFVTKIFQINLPHLSSYYFEQINLLCESIGSLFNSSHQFVIKMTQHLIIDLVSMQNILNAREKNSDAKIIDQLMVCNSYSNLFNRRNKQF